MTGNNGIFQDGPIPMRKAVFGVLTLGLAALAAGAAQAADVAVSYNVDVGPLTVTVVRLKLDETGGEVHAKARIESNGVSRIFSEFGATAEAQTRLGTAAPQPVSYRIERDDSDKRKVTTVTWNGGIAAGGYHIGIRHVRQFAKQGRGDHVSQR